MGLFGKKKEKKPDWYDKARLLVDELVRVFDLDKTKEIDHVEVFNAFLYGLLDAYAAEEGREANSGSHLVLLLVMTQDFPYTPKQANGFLNVIHGKKSEKLNKIHDQGYLNYEYLKNKEFDTIRANYSSIIAETRNDTPSEDFGKNQMGLFRKKEKKPKYEDIARPLVDKLIEMFNLDKTKEIDHVEIFNAFLYGIFDAHAHDQKVNEEWQGSGSPYSVLLLVMTKEFPYTPFQSNRFLRVINRRENEDLNKISAKGYDNYGYLKNGELDRIRMNYLNIITEMET